MVKFKNVKQGATLTCKYTDTDMQGNKVGEKIVVKIDKVGDSEWIDYDSIESAAHSLREKTTVNEFAQLYKKAKTLRLI